MQGLRCRVHDVLDERESLLRLGLELVRAHHAEPLGWLCHRHLVCDGCRARVHGLHRVQSDVRRPNNGGFLRGYRLDGAPLRLRILHSETACVCIGRRASQHHVPQRDRRQSPSHHAPRHRLLLVLLPLRGLLLLQLHGLRRLEHLRGHGPCLGCGRTHDFLRLWHRQLRTLLVRLPVLLWRLRARQVTAGSRRCHHGRTRFGRQAVSACGLAGCSFGQTVSGLAIVASGRLYFSRRGDFAAWACCYEHCWHV
mmetsp:Transcript_38620/g.122787  ORF Transcript_38620/g.122787 Transcript_38620/m.122787 type:complete len:253 (+) Transcript_38620:104-862(+)